ncbi:hypothetical protein ASPZODRAFT_143938 [Penicilliopsis zonata CBS 506.65]|uniref:C2H2-type domain-containing protein n=1 Tax=Penicilliopsis zonata CBS 506.65 TaxID=1073090 RepID=A0A1L9SDL8_9EURO|nr:hypothetical protein ASPZODRAFT_143938 [Penicilliopsis zonata CBS 506.65]OJJ45296.1 hypothetical protein ASPZODRAFT_143938 [Penicilliopsis zonata CBS 506.65]
MDESSIGVGRRRLRSQARHSLGPFQCRQCHKSFSRIENLTRHAENHRETTRFSCSICSRGFTRSDLLKRHVKIHGDSERSSNTANSRRTGDSEDAHNDHSQAGSPGVQISPLETDNNPTVPSVQVVAAPQPVNLNHTQILNNEDYDPQSVLEVGTGSAMGLETGHTFHRDGLSDEIPSISMIQHTTASNLGLRPASADLYLGIYGEGSFHTDLAWILDNTPVNDINYQGFDSTFTGVAEEPFIHPQRQRMSLEEVLQGATSQDLPHLRSDHENEDNCTFSDPRQTNWPDEEVHLESSGPLWTTITDPRSWVDSQEIKDFNDLWEKTQHWSCKVDAGVRDRILQTLSDNSAADQGLAAADGNSFPTAETLEYFIQLYIFHVHPRFPVVHPATFTPANSPSFLLLSMILAGSNYTKSNRGKFSVVYLHTVMVMFLRLQSLDIQFLRSNDNIFTLLLLCVSGTWSGQKAAFELAEGARGILVTACRRCRLLDCRPKTQPSDPQSSRSKRTRLRETWKSWIDLEQRKRLGLSIYIFDLQFPALFNNQPYIGKAEIINLVLPCASTFWEAASPEAWKVLLGPAELPSSMYFMVSMDTCLLYPAIRKEPPYAPLDAFGKTILMYAIFAHIYEWRQTVSIVVYKGFTRAPEVGLFEPGDGLKERQGWLYNALACWRRYYHYGDPTWRKMGSMGTEPSSSGLLLNYLAEICVDTNISDVHLVAGRSGLEEDIHLAEESLRRWCDGTRSEHTIERVNAMLAAAYNIIEQGHASECGFEIAVCLLTGGLLLWVYHRLGERGTADAQLQKASQSLEQFGSWGICTNFARILRRFIA